MFDRSIRHATETSIDNGDNVREYRDTANKWNETKTTKKTFKKLVIVMLNQRTHTHIFDDGVEWIDQSRMVEFSLTADTLA